MCACIWCVLSLGVMGTGWDRGWGCKRMLSGVSERLLEGPCLFLEESSMAGQAWPPGTPAKVDVGICGASLENLLHQPHVIICC